MAAAAAVRATHVYGLGIDDLVQTRRGPPGFEQTYFFHADEQGTITAATDSSGTVVERYSCGDYGSVTILAPDGTTVRTTSVIANRHLYTGRLWLGEIGLYEYRHRYYDPNLGRFITRDPTGYAFGMNLCAYLNGDPMAFVDPFGLCPVRTIRFSPTTIEYINAWIKGYYAGAAEGGFGIGGSYTFDYLGFQDDLAAHFGFDIDNVHAGNFWGNVSQVAAGGAGVLKFGVKQVAAHADDVVRTVASSADDAVRGAARGGIATVRTGQQGEAAVRAATHIGPATRITINGATRIPDGLTGTVLSEVKNVRSLSYTQQLRDFEAFARQSGRQFDLYVRPTTQLSGPLKDAVRAGEINLRIIPVP